MQAFPTDQRMRQKEIEKDRKALGIEPKRKPKPKPEQHFDDCGEDMSPLLFLDAQPDACSYLALEDNANVDEGHVLYYECWLLSSWWLYGSDMYLGETPSRDPGAYLSLIHI